VFFAPVVRAIIFLPYPRPEKGAIASYCSEKEMIQRDVKIFRVSAGGLAPAQLAQGFAHQLRSALQLCSVPMDLVRRSASPTRFSPGDTNWNLSNQQVRVC
jgi:hypothetical protein